MKKRIFLNIVLVAMTLLLTTDVFAHSHKVGYLTVKHPWARASSTVGGVFMTIQNAGQLADRLIEVKGKAAKHISIHLTIMEDMMMKMKPIASLEIPAGGDLVFGPGGYHLMMKGLLKPLVKGETFPLTLVFEHAGEVEVSVKIERAGAMKSMGMDHKTGIDLHH